MTVQLHNQLIYNWKMTNEAKWTVLYLQEESDVLTVQLRTRRHLEGSSSNSTVLLLCPQQQKFSFFFFEKKTEIETAEARGTTKGIQ